VGIENSNDPLGVGQLLVNGRRKPDVLGTLGQLLLGYLPGIGQFGDKVFCLSRH